MVTLQKIEALSLIILLLGCGCVTQSQAPRPSAARETVQTGARSQRGGETQNKAPEASVGGNRSLGVQVQPLMTVKTGQQAWVSIQRR